MKNLIANNFPLLQKDKLTLAKEDIHIWITKPTQLFASNSQRTLLLKQYSSLLTEEETIKQQRYKFDIDKHDALITRAFIRDLLSYYADVSPNA